MKQRPPTTRREKKSLRRRLWKRAKPMPMREKVLKRFEELICDSGLRDLNLLACFGTLRPQVLFYDSEQRVFARETEQGVAPWPLVWLLTRFNRKHILEGRRCPPEAEIRDSLIQFERRFRWRYLLRNNESRDARFVKIPRAPVMPVYSTTTPDLEAWLASFRRCVAGAATVARSRALARRCSNMTRLTRYCQGWYRRAPIVAIANDKEPGYTVLSLPALKAVHEEILSSKDYREISADEISKVKWYEGYGRQCMKMAVVERSKGLAKNLQKSADMPHCKPATKLLVTAKTHKPRAAFRNVHAGGATVFSGLSIFLGQQLQQILDRLPHILPSCEAFASWAASIRVEEGEYMLRFDIKHFFMSGTADDMSTGAAMIFPSCKRRVYRDVLMWLLGSQYIQSDYLPGRVWCVTKGTGMGQQASGPVADAAYYTRCEADFAVNDEVKKKYEIKEYVRFKDDIFVLAKSRSLTKTWFHELRRRAAPIFELECESVSQTQVEMLSMIVQIRGNRLVTFPKPQPKGLTLDQSSAHAATVHSSWPKAYMRTMARTCSSHEMIRPACEDFISRLTHSGANPAFLRWLHDGIDDIVSGTEKTNVSKPDRTWLIFKYHPAYAEGGFFSRVNSFLKHPFWTATFSTLKARELVHVGLGFANGSSHLHVKLRKRA